MIYFVVYLSSGDLCRAGYYCVAGTALEEECPMGTYNPSRAGESKDTACLTCDPGKYCNGTALTEPTGNTYLTKSNVL